MKRCVVNKDICLRVSTVLLGGITFAASADSFPVSDQPYLWLNSEGATLTADYLRVPMLPETKATLLYHFDANQTNGWSVSAAGEVTEVPSLAGERKLVNVKPQDWASAAVPPKLQTNIAELNGGNALDFGPLGSRRLLTFNGDSQTLAGFRSVVVVYGSEDGGGFFLGGIPGASNPGPYAFHRGKSRIDSTADGFTRWDNTLIYNGYGLPALGSYAWHDGAPTSPQYVGFKGGWEVVSFCQPKSVTLETSGLGSGDVRRGQESRSGGMKIAEILFYAECLPDADRKAVEAYLQKKWFGRTVAGYDGRASAGLVYAHRNTDLNNSGGLNAHSERIEVGVQEGGILEIDELKGGHAPISILEKTGAGTLALGESKGYGAPVRLLEGEISFPRKAIPQAIPCAEDAFLHVDASVGHMTTVEAGGADYVTHWRNESAMTWGGQAVYLHAANDATRPLLVANALNGRSVVDFGPAVGEGGLRLDLTTSDATRLTAVDGVVTTIAVVDVTDGGGSLFGFCDTNDVWCKNPFTRMSNGTTKFRNGFADPNHMDSYLDNNGLTMRDCVHYVDGVRVDPTKGYPTPGWHVVAIQTPGCRVSSVGAQDGGFRLAELVSWRKPLTEAETRDAVAYLAAKWLKRRVPGYASPEGAEENANGDLRNLTVADGTAIRVEGTGTVRVENLTAEGDLVKRGSGKLHLAGDVVMGGAVKVEGGSVEVVPASDVASDCELAKDPSFHVDASDLATMKITESDGKKYVTMWFDADGRDNAAVNPNVVNSPWLNETDKLNGKPIVDFGEWKSKRSLHFCRSLNGIRSAFVVLGSQNGGGDLLGSSFFPYDGSSVGIYDFMRGEIKEGGEIKALGQLFYGGYFSFFGPIYVNGVKGSQSTVLSGGYELVDVHPTSGAHASAFAGTRLAAFDSLGYDHNGGQRLAEVVLYERELSDRERQATRNYLMKKWFGTEPQALPDRAEKVAAIKSVEVDGSTSLGGDDSFATESVAGSGALTKIGGGVLTVGDFCDFVGSVAVEDGTLKLTRGYAPLPAELPTEGMTLHLDATRGVTCDTSGNVTSWANLVENKAVCRAAPVSYNNKHATLDSQGLDYAWQKCVNMPEYSSFRFEDTNGHLTTNLNIRSIFWVLGSQAGGGFILAGSFGTNHYSFHRGNNGEVTNSEAPILYGNYGDECILRNSSWYMNGERIDPFKKGFSGNWDLVSMVSDGDAYATQAEGLAADARQFYSAGASFQSRLGNQRLAELIMYETVLTEDQRSQVEAYLANKWGVGVGRRAVDRTEIDVSVAADAVLDLGGTDQHVVSLAGAGTVRNGSLTVAGLSAVQSGPTIEGDLTFEDGATWSVATSGDGNPLTIGGVMTFGSNMVIALPEVTKASDIVGKSVVVATGATDYLGIDRLNSVTVVTGAKSPIAIRVRFGVNERGELVLRGLGNGMVVIVK